MSKTNTKNESKDNSKEKDKNRKQTKSELFLELAKPNKKGYSRWVYVKEFNGKYATLKSNNGYEWARCGSKGGKTKTPLNTRFEIEKQYNGKSLYKIRLNGLSSDI